jgi:ribonuclease HI|tara:strand:- start:836 stop:1279 length:444 start_codon:yes stop_codon:yes gene_type:complete
LIKVYTDGSCLGNPGNGGWAFVIINEKDISYRAGFERNTTNNQMELMAAIKAIEFLDKYNDINLNTDSNYVRQGITNWILNWKRNNWKTSTKKAVKNRELWERLDKLNLSKNIIWSWVKAHNVDEFNNQVDQLARQAAETLTESSFN